MDLIAPLDPDEIDIGDVDEDEDDALRAAESAEVEVEAPVMARAHPERRISGFGLKRHESVKQLRGGGAQPGTHSLFGAVSTPTAYPMAKSSSLEALPRPAPVAIPAYDVEDDEAPEYPTGAPSTPGVGHRRAGRIGGGVAALLGGDTLKDDGKGRGAGEDAQGEAEREAEEALYDTGLSPPTGYTGAPAAKPPPDEQKKIDKPQEEDLAERLYPPLSKKDRRNLTLRAFLDLAGTQKHMLLGGTMLGLLSVIASLVVPALMGISVDVLLASDSAGDLVFVFVFVAVASVFSILLTMMYGAMFVHAGERILSEVRYRLFSHILEQEAAFFDLETTPILVSRLVGDVDNVVGALCDVPPTAASGILATVGSIAIMAFISWQLTLVTLVAGPILAVITERSGAITKRYALALSDARAKVMTAAMQGILGVEEMRLFTQEALHVDKFHESIHSEARLSIRAGLFGGLFRLLTNVWGYSTVVFVLAFGAIMVVQGTLTPGTLFSYNLYMTFALNALDRLSGAVRQFMGAQGTMARFQQILSRPSSMPLNRGLKPELVGDIAFNSVAFTYPSRPKTRILDDVSFTVPTRSVVAIVGTNGSGKTTCLNLLLRLYDPDSGSVVIDGHDVRTLSPAWLRQQISCVKQDPILFDGMSIFQNILYANPEATEAQVYDAATKANADSFVRALPKGYHTIVGQGRGELSGGQRQMVALARAFLKRAPILVLDEPTSAMDADAEARVARTLLELAADKTVLMVAHQLKTIVFADIILVLHRGRIMDSGTHAQLMEGCELYQRWVAHQSLEQDHFGSRIVMPQHM